MELASCTEGAGGDEYRCWPGFGANRSGSGEMRPASSEWGTCREELDGLAARSEIERSSAEARG
jgi:hypothetical protein